MRIQSVLSKPTGISSRTWNERYNIADSFRSNLPLYNFTVVNDFLSPDFFISIQNFAQRASMERYCVFSRSEDSRFIEKGFSDPDERYYYLSVHKRMRHRHGVPADIEDLVGSSDMLAFLSAIAGTRLRGLEIPGTLTGWDPGHFLGEHTDEGDPQRPTKLVVSLSLTSSWKPEFGGMTHYQWLGHESEIVVEPTANTATLFQPGEHSVHWVTPINGTAPANKRYTWTLDYF